MQKPYKLIILDPRKITLPTDIEEHIHLIGEKKISSICMPLKKLGIEYFLYIKTYQDESRIQLTNNVRWSENFYNKQYYKLGAFETPSQEYKPGFYLWSTLPCQIIYEDLKQQFGIDHGITLVEKNIDGYEFFHYGSNVGNQAILNLYLNNAALLKRFSLYFKDKASIYIKQAESCRVLYAKLNLAQSKPNQQRGATKDNQLKDDFIKSTIIERYQLIFNNKNIQLSRREIECIEWSSKGLTSKQIAKILAVSPRTIEEHVANIKRKVGCNKLAQINYLLAGLIA